MAWLAPYFSRPIMMNQRAVAVVVVLLSINLCGASSKDEQMATSQQYFRGSWRIVRVQSPLESDDLTAAFDFPLHLFPPEDKEYILQGNFTNSMGKLIGVSMDFLDDSRGSLYVYRLNDDIHRFESSDRLLDFDTSQSHRLGPSRISRGLCQVAPLSLLLPSASATTSSTPARCSFQLSLTSGASFLLNLFHIEEKGTTLVTFTAARVDSGGSKKGFMEQYGMHLVVMVIFLAIQIYRRSSRAPPPPAQAPSPARAIHRDSRSVKSD